MILSPLRQSCLYCVLVSFWILQAVGFSQDVLTKNLNITTLNEVLGKGQANKEYKTLATIFQKDPKVEKFDDCYHHMWPNEGLSLRFEKNMVSAIFLYASGADGFSKYRGELPAGIQFSDTRAEVERKLGQPTKTGGNGVIQYWVSYPARGLALTYDTKDTKDKAARIHHITLSVQGASDLKKEPLDPLEASSEKMKTLVHGMHSYDTPRLPAHAIYDQTGKRPLLSWRVAILPSLELESLYKRFRLNEPWDSEHNKPLIKEMPAIYKMPGIASQPGMTHYQVFTMPTQVGPGQNNKYMPIFSLSPRRVSLGQISAKDGTTNTICIAEAKVPVEWTRPLDLVLENDDAPLPALGIRPGADEFLIATAFGDCIRVRTKIADMDKYSQVMKQMIGWKDGVKYDPTLLLIK